MIYKQMALVMSEIGPIAKDRKNESQGYSFRGIDDVYEAVNGALIKHAVFCMPKVLKSERSERQSRGGSPLLHSTIEMRYTFYCEDGSFVEAETLGEGMDSGDKASNKAMSAAQKYAFLQAFCIPTREPKDSENESPVIIFDAGDYCARGGKYANIPIKSIAAHELESYIKWAKLQPSQSSLMQEFVLNAEEFLKSNATNKEKK